MTPAILQWLCAIKAKYALAPKNVLEIGSRNINGSPREVFGDAERYVGVDMREGNGVDLVLDAHGLDMGETFDLVLCCEMLEHDPDPLATARVMRDHLALAGKLVVTSPARGFRRHRNPKDYWRLMPDAYRDLVYRGMEILELKKIEGPTWCCIGTKK